MPTTSTAPSARRDLAPFAVFLLTLLPFLPVVRNGFVNWDDVAVLVENARYRGFAAAQLRWMFTTVDPGPYQPLSWLTLSLDQSLWGVNALAFHLTNLLLHALNAAVFYEVCRLLLTAALPEAARRDDARLSLSAAVAALLFSVHPLRVESVVWATERRDVLCGLFFLLAARSYLGAAAHERSRPPGGGATLGFFLLALLSKGVAVSLPITLLAMDVWPLRRLSADPRRWREAGQRRVLLEKIPYFALSLVFLTIGYVGKRDAGGLHPATLRASILQPLYGLFFYVGKTVLPWPLSPLYERPSGAELLAPKFVLGSLAAVGLGAAVFLRRRKHPAPVAAAAHYAAALAPMLGIVSFGPQIVADRFSYLACLALPPFAVVPLLTARDERGFRRRLAAGAALLLALAALTWRQTGIWRDTPTLWNAALAADPDNATAHVNLGSALDRRGDEEAAEAEYRRGLSLRPGDFDGQLLLGRLLLKRGRLAEAAARFETAASVAPGEAMPLYLLAVTLAEEKRWDEAISRYREALALDPGNARLRSGLGAALLAAGRPEQALAQFRGALESRPDDPSARVHAAVILIRLGRYQEAAAELRLADAAERLAIALRVAPPEAAPHDGLGLLLARERRWDQEIFRYREALALDPRDARARDGLGAAQNAQDRLDEGFHQFGRALEWGPGDAATRNNVAVVLIRRGRYEEADQELRLVLRDDPSYAPALANRALLLRFGKIRPR